MVARDYTSGYYLWSFNTIVILNIYINVMYLSYNIYLYIQIYINLKNLLYDV